MKKYIIMLHILFWISVPFVLTFINWLQIAALTPLKSIPIRSYSSLLRETALINLFIVFVGINSFYLSESIILYPSKKKIIYKTILLLSFPVLLNLSLTYPFFAVYWSFPYFVIRTYMVVLPFSIMGSLSAVIKKFIRAKDELLMLEKANTTTQLELVKSKTDPHFLFNTINNIDALISRDPEQASQYLNRLSGLLRFMLYESSNEKILLTSEINYVQEYINLEKIRSVNPEFINFHITGRVNGQLIAPMVLIPILENAFKHSSRMQTDAIVLNLNADDKQIFFSCRNKYENRNTKNGGLGWQLLKQRLDLIYGSCYSMEINKDEHYYEVILKLF
ncbi:hypothetical protein DVR12_05510 [Chitinophaga silvatica]|uniref:Signal transduction histidine kinase internal region domain-containing protein n=1 Tax=Chitinophaga silvatica TaxID=2282649 RepID=A0A3E1YDH8_9BACT|nr:histidine kinase [Chitinophaga silvatica]RFS24660.1 hypothetical protein DVR12_05510 [Chitinophaga silvatica]